MGFPHSRNQLNMPGRPRHPIPLKITFGLVINQEEEAKARHDQAAALVLTQLQKIPHGEMDKVKISYRHDVVRQDLRYGAMYDPDLAKALGGLEQKAAE